MNDRERFRRTLLFEDVDRPPFGEFLGYWPETVNRWYGEGLPLNYVRPEVAPLTNLNATIGETGAVSIYEYFGFDKIAAFTNDLAIDFGQIPRFVPKVLEDTERYTVVRGEAGITSKALKSGVSFPGFVDFPIKTRQDFENMKSRYDSNNPLRYPKAWSADMVQELRASDRPVLLVVPGFFGQARSWLGLERLLITFYKDGSFVHEFLDFWCDFITRTMEKALSSAAVDMVYIWEDMSYRDGPHVSPRIFDEFFLPRYKKLTSYIRKSGIEIIGVDTDGDADPITPSLIEGGVNCLFPLEVAANVDARTLRKKYGKKLALIGNIDKRVLAMGKDEITKEVDSKVPEMVAGGGYIPSVDHLVPHDVPFENYKHYVQLLRKHLGVETA